MKTWVNPGLKIFNVKMDENIAASGRDIRRIQLQDGTYDFRVSGNVIVDTSECTFVSDGGQYIGRWQGTGSLYYWQVKGCLA